MKKIISFVTGAICLLVFWLFMGYGNRAVHPSLNAAIVDKFEQNFVSTAYSPLERFKNYTFVLDGTFGYTGTEVSKRGFTDMEEAVTDKNALGWIIHGGFSADEPEIHASFRHFYDPTEPSGKRYLHNHLDKIEFVNPQIDHIEWALTHIDHAYNWDNGLMAMELALTSTTESIRSENLAFAYRSLGETLHMIADMGCPSHVRDDSHASFTWFQFGSPDPYEEYFESFSEVKALFYYGKTDPDLRSSFRNAERVHDIATELAKYTNENFFTSQTISGKKIIPLIHPEKTYPSPKLEDFQYDEKTYTYSKDISGNEVKMCKDYRYGIINTRGYPYVDKECTLSQGQALVPQILEAGANVIRLFIPDLKVEITKFDETLKTITGKVVHETSSEYYTQIKYSGEVTIYNAKSLDKITVVACVNGDFKKTINLRDFKNVNWKDFGIYGQIEFGSIYVKSEPFKQIITGKLVVETDPITNITRTGATCGGDVKSDGGEPVTNRGVCWSTSENPTITDSHTDDGSGLGVFTSKIEGLTTGDEYYVRAFATNSGGTAYGDQDWFTPSGTCVDSTFKYEGRTYTYTTIGTQIWMTENLAFLPKVDSVQWWGDTNPRYYVYGYTGKNLAAAKATANYATYGVLYNWNAAAISCPPGWHLPSDAEWGTLKVFYGQFAGGDLKEAGTGHWASPNMGATNSSCFTALPGGQRTFDPGFDDIGKWGFFWTSTLRPEDKYGYVQYMSSLHDQVVGGPMIGHLGLSVRCIKD